jgi:hypothetical protein
VRSKWMNQASLVQQQKKTSDRSSTSQIFLRLAWHPSLTLLRHAFFGFASLPKGRAPPRPPCTLPISRPLLVRDNRRPLARLHVVAVVVHAKQTHPSATSTALPQFFGLHLHSLKRTKRRS